MNIQTCKFVNASDVLSPEALELISNSNFTYGSNNRSLVNAKDLHEYLSDCDCESDPTADFTSLQNIPADVYVDLEN